LQKIPKYSIINIERLNTYEIIPRRQLHMFYDLLRSRRSIRKFENREIEKDKIDTILKSAVLSPSSRGRRPWEFIAVTDKDALQKLSVCREHGSQFLAGAALGIVVAANSEDCDVWIEDASIAAVIIQLSAKSLGLGSCWIQVRERLHSDGRKAGDYVKEVLGIPAKYSVECIIAIGYPAENKKPYEESDMPQGKVHYNRF
jgi:nitroreductase